MTKAHSVSIAIKFLAVTYQTRARRYGCRGGRQVTDKSLIQAVVKPYIAHHCGNAIWAKRLHGEPRANHRGRMQVQVHVLPKGRESVVQGRRERPPVAMDLPGHIVGQVSSLRVYLHRSYKHVVWGEEWWKGSHVRVPTSNTLFSDCCLAFTLSNILHQLLLLQLISSNIFLSVFGQGGVRTFAFSHSLYISVETVEIVNDTILNYFAFYFYCCKANVGGYTLLPL